MESTNQQLASLRLTDDADDDGKRDWASLPLDLLKICLSAPPFDQASKRAALASCKAFGRAVVRSSSHGLGLEVDRLAPPFARTTHVWAELWGDELPQQGQRGNLMLFSESHGNPARCLSELLSANQCLPFITELSLEVRLGPVDGAAQRPDGDSLHSRRGGPLLCTQCLTLDALIPPGLSALLPNLQHLQIDHCVLTPAARTSVLDVGFSKLWRLAIEGLSVQALPGPHPATAQPPVGLHVLATAQLMQLAKLPSISSVPG